jgi:hypothetical protein
MLSYLHLTLAFSLIDACEQNIISLHFVTSLFYDTCVFYSLQSLAYVQALEETNIWRRIVFNFFSFDKLLQWQGWWENRLNMLYWHSLFFIWIRLHEVTAMWILVYSHVSLTVTLNLISFLNICMSYIGNWEKFLLENNK